MTDTTRWETPPPATGYVYTTLPRQPRDVGIAYLLLVFLGMFGAHRFYVARTGTAVAQLLMTVLLIGIPVTFVWVIVDLFLLSGHVRELNDAIADAQRH